MNLTEKPLIYEIGRGFSKLYKPFFSIYGYQALTYFNFKRPKGLTLTFRDFARRTYTPFLINLKSPAKDQEFLAAVSLFKYNYFSA